MNLGQLIGANAARGGFDGPSVSDLEKLKASAVARKHEARSEAEEIAAAVARSNKSADANSKAKTKAERNVERSRAMKEAWARRKAAHQHGLASGGQ